MDPRITRPILFAEWPALMMLGTMVFTFLRLILYANRKSRPNPWLF